MAAAELAGLFARLAGWGRMAAQHTRPRPASMRRADWDVIAGEPSNAETQELLSVTPRTRL